MPLPDAAPAPAVSLLLVDDPFPDRHALDAALGGLGVGLVHASAAEALRRLPGEDFAAILLGPHGLATATAVRDCERSRHTPILFLLPEGGEPFPPAEAYRLGLVDHLAGPLVPEVLRGRVEVFVELARQAAQLRRVKARQSAILEAALDAVITIDLQGLVVEWSPQAERTFGYSRAEVINKEISGLVAPPSLRAQYRAWLERGLAPGEGPIEDHRGEMLAMRASGEEFPVEVAISPVATEPSLFTASIRDLTDRKRSEQELRASERRFAGFMQHLPGLAWIKDAAGHYVYANDAAERAFGTPRAKLYGRVDEELFPPQTAAQFRENDRLALEGAEVRRIETLEQADGVHHSLVSKFVIPGTGTEPVLIGGVAFDITDRLKAEEALREANRRKDEMLAMLAHELRGPLATLTPALRALRQDELTAEQHGQAVERMERQVAHLRRLVDDLLDASVIIHGRARVRLERLDLARLVRLAAEDRRPLLEGDGLRLSVETPETPVWVKGDAVRLTQALDNLLDNAAKYTGRGGEVGVAVTTDTARGQALVRVADTGEGIAADVLARLFRPFEQGKQGLDRRRGGLGLGLAVVKGLIELHGGEVQAASGGPGQGATLTIRLPLESEPPALSRRLKRSSQGVRRCRVLIVEDNPDAADSLRLLLELLGHEARVALSGPEGVAAAAEWPPDVVISDIGLPGFDGYEVARRLRALPAARRARLVALTGYGADEDRQRGREAGFDHYLVKPADPADLQRIVAGQGK